MELRRTYSEDWNVESVKNIGKHPWEGQEITLKNGDETAEIRVISSRVVEEIEEFRDGKRTRLFFAFGMRDIDVYRRSSGLVVLENSPTEMQDYHYALASEKELNKLIEGFKACLETTS